MNKALLKANLILLTVAAIWGLAFVAQRVGMEHVGPFTFNAARFGLGSIALVPLIIYGERRKSRDTPQSTTGVMIPGIAAGLILFIAAALQQIGLVDTTAGKAAFLTSVYLVIVPLFSLLMHQTVGKASWSGAVLALVGVYLLSVNDDLSIAGGDLFVMGSAVFWAVHILVIDRYADKVDVIKLAAIQFITCSGLSLGAALLWEQITVAGLSGALNPILYAGIGSVGIAYTLQIVGQKTARPAHAAIILSMETVFGALGGWLLLSEIMTDRGIVGCLFMLLAMVLPQIQQCREDERYAS